MSLGISITRIGVLKCAAALVVFSILFPVSLADDAGQTDSESGEDKDKYLVATVKINGTSWKKVSAIIMPQNESSNSSNSSNSSSGGEARESLWMVGTRNGTIGVSVLETEDGGYIVLGDIFEYEAFGTVAESRDILLLKTDPDGREEWNRTFGGDDWDQGYSIQKMRDGGYIIAGLTRSLGTEGTDGQATPDLWLIKTDPSGGEIWNRTFGGPRFDAGRFVGETADGGYLISGDTCSFGSGDTDVWIIKTDSEGAEEWNRTIGGDENNWDGRALATEDGGCVLVYNQKASVGAFGIDTMLLKTDQKGDDIWSTKFGGTGDQYGKSVRASEDGGYTVGGYGSLLKDPWMAKADPDGKKVWKWDLNDLFNLDPDQRVFKAKDGGFTSISPKLDPSYELYDFQTTGDGGYIILSRNPAREVCLTKVNPDGVEEWNSTYSKYDISWGNSVMETSDGGYIITGSQANDLCLMKTDSEGVLEWNRIFLTVSGGLEIDTQKRTRR